MAFEEPSMGEKKDNIVKIQGSLSELAQNNYHPAGAEINEWKDKAEANKIFEHFFLEGYRNIREEDVKQYVDESGDSSEIVDALRSAFFTRSSAEEYTKRVEANAHIQAFITMLEKRNAVLREAKNQLRTLAASEKIPPLTGGAVERAKTALHAIGSGFMNATTGEKLLMIAGVAAIVLFAKKSLELADKTRPTKIVKNLVGGGLGVGALGLIGLMGYEAAWKATQRTKGAGTGIELWRPPWMEKDVGNIDRAYQELLDANMPVELIVDDLSSNIDKQKSFSFGIANVAGMKAKDFLEMYSDSLLSKTITKDSAEYPRRPYTDDGLTAVERWEMVHQIGLTLGLIDTDTGQPVTISPDEAELSILYLSMERYEGHQKMKSTAEEEVSESSSSDASSQQAGRNLRGL